MNDMNDDTAGVGRTTARRTTTEAKLREMVASGLTHSEIAERLGCARSSIANTCAVLGITSDRGATTSRGMRRKAAKEKPSAPVRLPSFVFQMGTQ